MRANRSRDTSPELAIRKALHALGYRYRVNYRPLTRDRRRSVDIAFTRLQVAILIDGCYWHGCPQHFIMPKANREYWSSKIARNRERDAETTRLLADAGWLALRYWEHQPAGEVVSDIVKNLESRRAEG